MGCPASVRLADYHAGRLDEGARATIGEHLAGCARCRTAAGRVAGALDALRESATLDPPEVSSARIEATLRWTRQVPRIGPARAPIFVGLGAAAAAALALALWSRHPQRPPTLPPPATVVAQRAAQPAPRAQPLDALITLLGGDVQLTRDGGVRAADFKLALTTGDRLTVAAAGRLALQWGEGSGALVHGASELALARLDPRAQELRLARGEVSVRVGPHQPGESLRVITPDHEVIVHGTWFNVVADARGGTTIEVLEGVVEVRSIEGDGVSTRVAAPQRAVFARGHGAATSSRSLSGREAASLRGAGEMALLSSWTSADRAAAATGMLQVASIPAAQLVVDGVAFGTTPVALRRSQGGHFVELSRPGFATMSRWVTVGAEPGELRVALAKSAALPVAVPPAEDEMRQILRGRRRQISSCYEHSLKRDPTLAGTVTIAISVGDAGQVLATKVESNTLPDPEVTACLRREAAGWAFPAARNATVVYPFVFRTPSGPLEAP